MWFNLSTAANVSRPRNEPRLLCGRKRLATAAVGRGTSRLVASEMGSLSP